MQSLQFILSIGLVIYSIYSVIAYLGRRHDNKNSLRQLQELKQGFRQLTSEERAYLQPFLVDPMKPGKVVELNSDEVFKIAGEFVRHGLHVSNGGETMHDTLADIDVVLPYDARNFLDVANSAEVVLTPKFAIVIRLNDAFDLKGGRDRAQLEQVRQQQWEAGKTGELPDQPMPVDAPAGNDETANPNPDSEADIAQVRILGQRNETAAEAAARNHPGWGWLPTLALVPAFILLMMAGTEQNYWPWLAPSLLFFALALWLIWRARGPSAPRKVNRVQGALTMISLQSHGNSNVVREQLFLGDKFPIVMPDHWKEHATIPADSQVTLEMRVDDYSVVRFGKQLSIDKEEQRFPSIYWGRHLTLMLAGLTMLLAAWLFNDHIMSDVAHVRAGLLGGDEQKLEQAAALLAQPPTPGSMVRVRAEVRCQVAPAKDNNPPPIDCRQVRWGGDELRVEPVEPDAGLLRFYAGETLQAHKNAMLDLMVQMQMAQATDPMQRFMPRPSLLVLSDLTDLILGIDKECKLEGVSNRPACAALQKTMGEKLLLDDGDKALGWEELLKQARDGTLKKNDDTAIATDETVSRLKMELHEVASAHMRKAFEAPLQTLLKSQHGGIVLPLGADQTFGGDTDETAATGNESRDWPTQWAAYGELAKPYSLKTLELSGLLVSANKNTDGDMQLDIDTQRTRSNYQPALLRLLALLVGAGFMATHGLLWIVNLGHASRRSQAIKAFYQTRHA